ncbi:YqgQ family protein [Pseudogracilibacillus sp. SO30301A]|uniref:YqgQ family protein n=1 Tax=Pseudogracilibacillus sp. SO30301A TaxID=3098291 RepID=UPI00300E6368
MKTVLDVRNLLKQFGVFIYTGDRISDLELMHAELNSLYEVKLIDVMTYKNAIFILKKEISDLST